MSNTKCDIGMIGLGVMGRNLVLNIADHGFSAAGYDKDPEKTKALREDAKDKAVKSCEDIKEFVSLLRSPKVVMMLVPAGGPVDSVIKDVLPFLKSGDIIIDGGNSHFPDTELRETKLARKGIAFLGVGVSGGEHGARYGPSIMPGGPKEAYEHVRPVFEAVAAHVDHFPCVTYLGPHGTGHYVKMVHNGIEYGIMQLIAETYDLMKRGLGFSDDQLSEVYDKWNKNELSSFLVEITAHIFRTIDEKTGKRLVDVILDEAKQKGTGGWTSENAMELQVAVPNIDAGVEMRDLSCCRDLRMFESGFLSGPSIVYSGDKDNMVENIKNALCVASIITYSQGFALMAHASEIYKYGLNLENIAAIWQGGCIIRSCILENIVAAYKIRPNLPHLLADRNLGQAVVRHQSSLRLVVQTAAQLGIPAAGMMNALSYFDVIRSSWLPANLIQAQRDYFGSHTYERIDAKGTFHTQWAQD